MLLWLTSMILDARHRNFAGNQYFLQPPAHLPAIASIGVAKLLSHAQLLDWDNQAIHHHKPQQWAPQRQPGTARQRAAAQCHHIGHIQRIPRPRKRARHQQLRWRINRIRRCSRLPQHTHGCRNQYQRQTNHGNTYPPQRGRKHDRAGPQPSRYKHQSAQAKQARIGNMIEKRWWSGQLPLHTHHRYHALQ